MYVLVYKPSVVATCTYTLTLSAIKYGILGYFRGQKAFCKELSPPFKYAPLPLNLPTGLLSQNITVTGYMYVERTTTQDTFRCPKSHLTTSDSSTQ